MARVNTYLNFQGQAEEAFAFYAKTFGTEVTMLSRYSDMPAAGPGQLPAEERNLVLHAELPIISGHLLMATDMLQSMGQETRIGNNTTLCLDVDSRKRPTACTAPCPRTARKDPRWPTCRGAPTGASPSTATASAGCSTTPRHPERPSATTFA